MPKSQPPTSQQPSHIKDLMLLFSIPLGIALLAAATVYIPRLLANPAYDFIYSYCSDYQCSDSYTINSRGHIEHSPAASGSRDNYHTAATNLSYYSVSTGASRILTYEEAKDYELLNSSKSPDGYTLAKSGGGGGFLFWGDHENAWQLENGLKKKPVQLTALSTYYESNIKFLGWIGK